MYRIDMPEVNGNHYMAKGAADNVSGYLDHFGNAIPNADSSAIDSNMNYSPKIDNLPPD